MWRAAARNAYRRSHHRPRDGSPLRALVHSADVAPFRTREGVAVGYEADIRPLFRESDRAAMHFIFDLWSYDDVKENAELILERLRDGTMPCDEPWDDDRIDRFRAWIAAGSPA